MPLALAREDGLDEECPSKIQKLLVKMNPLAFA